ncbi:MAG: right-handed parallel beta-helix repeat-containing protein, partial [Elusimicrobia bacterium]|nr:right-handed parallel beta-helix repeat-containing protein [Elusimicrobiota bacterium]
MRIRIKRYLNVFIIVLLGLVSRLNAATEFVCTVNTNGGGDYTNLNSWEGAIDGDLTTSRVLSHGGITGTIADGSFVKGATSLAYGTVTHATATQICITGITGTFQNAEQINKTDVLNGTPTGTDYVTASSAPDSVIAKVNCSGTVTDTTPVVIDGWTTSATNYIEVVGDNTSGKWDTNKYRLETANGSCIITYEDYIRINKLQLSITDSGASFRYCFQVLAVSGTNNDIWVSNCIMKSGASGGSGRLTGFNCQDGNGNFKIWNNVFYSPTYGDFWGVDFTSCNIAYVYSNTMYRCAYGLFRYNSGSGSRLVTAKNNAAFGSITADFWGILQAESRTNLSSDATADDYGTLGIINQTIDATNDVISLTANSEDFHLRSTADMVNAGTDTSGESAPLNFTTDIDGVTRIAASDIGADEYVYVAPTTVDKYIDTDLWTDAPAYGGSAGSGAYRSLSYAESQNQQDLVTNNRIMVFHCAGATADTTAVTIDGWTTSATNYVEVVGDNTTGKWDNGKYRISSTANYFLPLRIREEYTRINRVQFYSEYNNYSTLTLGDESGTITNITVMNCIITRKNDGYAVILSGNAGHKLYNNIIYSDGSGGIGIRCYWSTTSSVFNNTVSGFVTGIIKENGANTDNLKNNISYNNGTDYSGTFDSASTNNLSKDATAPALGTYYINKTLTFTNTTAGSEDFHLVSADTDAIDKGVDLSATFTTDID